MGRLEAIFVMPCIYALASSPELAGGYDGSRNDAAGSRVGVIAEGLGDRNGCAEFNGGRDGRTMRLFAASCARRLIRRVA